MTDQTRKEFEEWFQKSGMTKYKETARAAWEASRAAIEVELLARSEFAASDTPEYVLLRCRDMLLAQGLKVKP